MTYVITEPCIDVKDKSCIEECPVDCIYEGDRMLYIHPDECVDCGACEPVCPVEAIFYEDDVPAQWKDFTRRQRGLLHRGRGAARLPGRGGQRRRRAARRRIRRQLSGPRDLSDGPRLHAGGWAPQRSGRPCGQGWPAHAHCWAHAWTGERIS